MTSTALRVHVLLSVQRAFLGHIGTAMRAILCRWTEDGIHVRAIFDGKIADVDAEAVSEAESEVIADFPSQTRVSFKSERRDYPAPIDCEPGETAIFRRLERRV